MSSDINVLQSSVNCVRPRTLARWRDASRRVVRVRST